MSGISSRLYVNGNPVNAAFRKVGAQLQQKDYVEFNLANVVVVVVKIDRLFCYEIKF